MSKRSQLIKSRANPLMEEAGTMPVSSVRVVNCIADHWYQLRCSGRITNIFMLYFFFAHTCHLGL